MFKAVYHWAKDFLWNETKFRGWIAAAVGPAAVIVVDNKADVAGLLHLSPTSHALALAAATAAGIAGKYRGKKPNGDPQP